MSGAQHTPGPWEWSREDGQVVDAADGFPICDIHLDESDDIAREQEANARLIAAAPAMLAALEALVPPDFDEHPDDFMPDWHFARAALAKARGA